jgi:hypothetical protein
MINECGAVNGMRIGRENRSTGIKPGPPRLKAGETIMIIIHLSHT